MYNSECAIPLQIAFSVNSVSTVKQVVSLGAGSFLPSPGQSPVPLQSVTGCSNIHFIAVVLTCPNPQLQYNVFDLKMTTLANRATFHTLQRVLHKDLHSETECKCVGQECAV